MVYRATQSDAPGCPPGLLYGLGSTMANDMLGIARGRFADTDR